MRLWICYALELKDGFYLLWKSCFLIGVVSTSFWSSIEPVLSEYHAMDEVKGLLVSIECFCLKQDFLHSSTRVWLVIDHGVLLQINRSLGLLCSWCSLYLSKLIPHSLLCLSDFNDYPDIPNVYFFSPLAQTVRLRLQPSYGENSPSDSPQSLLPPTTPRVISVIFYLYIWFSHYDLKK